MKRYLFSFLALAFLVSGPLLAQDNPFLGSWKLNLAKSKFEPGTAPKSQTRTITSEGDSVKYAFEGVAADGTPFAYSFTVKYDGKDYPVTGKGAPYGADAVSFKRASSHKTEVTLKRAGIDIGAAVAEVSSDGKIATVKGKGKLPDGKQVFTDSVYDKQ
jgi:hypothetical protein